VILLHSLCGGEVPGLKVTTSFGEAILRVFEVWLLMSSLGRQAGRQAGSQKMLLYWFSDVTRLSSYYMYVASKTRAYTTATLGTCIREIKVEMQD
jgi:hypothetical protein